MPISNSAARIYSLCVRSLLLLSIILTSVRCQFFVPEEPSSEVVSRQCHLPPGNASLCVAPDRCPMLNAMFGNLRKPIPGDVSLIISNSFFCPRDNPDEDVQVCCPFEGIVDPIPDKRPVIRNKDSCSVQTGEPASCVDYNLCGPLLQLLTNLQRPFPPELSQIMRSGFLCGFSQQRLPQVCCPDAAVTVPQAAEPITDAQRFERHANREVLAASDDCGNPIQFKRIVNGNDSFLGQFPWLANLGYQLGSRPGVSFKCGGALIGRRYVLTAAHCVTSLPGSFRLARVRLGEHQLSTDRDCDKDDQTVCAPPVQDFEPEEVFFHQDYNKPNVFQNDIALIRLPRDAVYSEFVRPICLPFTDDSSESYKDDDEETIVAGWGATEERGRNPADILQFLNVSVFEGDQCREVYSDRGGIIDLSTQLCAGGEEGRDSCVGDSGSALMREIKPDLERRFRSIWKLIGVVSFGPKLCGTKGVPGVYSRVRHYIDWILDNVKS